jgi:hypothetical protein
MKSAKSAIVRAIAKQFKVNYLQVTTIERWANCFFAVIKGIGGRFVKLSVEPKDYQVEIKLDSKSFNAALNYVRNLKAQYKPESKTWVIWKSQIKWHLMDEVSELPSKPVPLPRYTWEQIQQFREDLGF